MNRRGILKAGVGAGLITLAGCTRLGSNDTPADTADETTGTAPARDVETVAGHDLPISQAEMSRVLPVDGLLAIEKPAFGQDWSGLEIAITSRGQQRTIRPRLHDEDEVIGIFGEETTRAYPIRLLNWHEVVNDTVDGEPLVITYCPLCASGMVATRRIAGEETVFGVSGLLWLGNLVMYDRETQTLWWQLAATAIQGEHWGATLDRHPSTFTTWADWRDSHPETEVLLPPPESRTVLADVLDMHDIEETSDYTVDPYAVFGSPGVDEDSSHPFTLVIGVAIDGDAIAYPLPEVEDAGLIHDTVGDTPVVVANVDQRTLVAYVRTRADDQREPLQFERVDEHHVQGGDTTWELTTGQAVDGQYEGEQLERANDLEPLLLGPWEDAYPDTSVYTAESTADGNDDG